MRDPEQSPSERPIRTLAAWTDLLGFASQMETSVENAACRLKVAHQTAAAHSTTVAPVLVVNDGFLSVCDWDESKLHDFVKAVAIIHYSLEMTERSAQNPGVRTVVCWGQRFELGPDHVLDTAAVCDLAEYFQRADPGMSTQKAVSEAYGHSRRLGIARYLAMPFLQFNLAFAKAYLADSALGQSDGRFFVEKEIAAALYPTNLGMSLLTRDGEPFRRSGLLAWGPLCHDGALRLVDRDVLRLPVPKLPSPVELFSMNVRFFRTKGYSSTEILERQTKGVPIDVEYLDGADPPWV